MWATTHILQLPHCLTHVPVPQGIYDWIERRHNEYVEHGSRLVGLRQRERHKLHKQAGHKADAHHNLVENAVGESFSSTLPEMATECRRPPGQGSRQVKGGHCWPPQAAQWCRYQHRPAWPLVGGHSGNYPACLDHRRVTEEAKPSGSLHGWGLQPNRKEEVWRNMGGSLQPCMTGGGRWPCSNHRPWGWQGATWSPLIKWMKEIWNIQPRKVIVLLLLIRSVNSLGVAPEPKAMSKKDKLVKKKYMGDCRRGARHARSPQWEGFPGEQLYRQPRSEWREGAEVKLTLTVSLVDSEIWIRCWTGFKLKYLGCWQALVGLEILAAIWNSIYFFFWGNCCGISNYS